MKYFLFFLLLISANPAFAQEGYPPECRLLPEHKASADVAYQPGVDVRGKPVVPADLNSQPVDMGQGQTIVVPLTVDLAQRLKGMNVQGLEMSATVGFLEIAPNGQVTYNGQDLTSQVHVLCDKTAASSAPAADGQTPPDVLE